MVNRIDQMDLHMNGMMGILIGAYMADVIVIMVRRIIIMING
jgi:hypothetical protein